MLAVLLASGCVSAVSSDGQSEAFKQAVLAGAAPSSTGAMHPPASAVDEPSSEATTIVPEPGVGQILSTSSYDVAVAGGKYVKLGKANYLALKVYVKDIGDADLMMFAVALSVEDDAGSVADFDYPALDRTNLLPPLDTSSYELSDGESTGGWVLFKITKNFKPRYLVIGDEEYALEIDSMRILLDGFQKVPSGSVAAKAYVKAARIGGARASATSVTHAEYLRVKTGMSLKKVNSIIGFKGKQMSSYNSGYFGTYSTYSWQNDDGSNMIVSFRNNREYMKAQAGL